jgi:TatD DNase family protein
MVVSETLEDAKYILELAHSNPKIHVGLGLHPVQRDSSAGDPGTFRDRCVRIEELEPMLDFIRAHKNEVSCIGEIGLDYAPRFVPTEEFKKVQNEVFKKQIKLADELDLPVSVHSRSAGHYALECLRECQAKKVIMHAFDGNVKYLNRGIQEGYFFSVPPSFTVTKNWIKKVPVDRLLVETDAPALSHVKGAKNILINGRVSVEYIAEQHGLAVEACAKQLLTNTKTLFKL